MDVRVDRAVVELDKDEAARSEEEGCWVGGVAGEPPSSRTDGSFGGGPSIAHLFDSYLDRMNDSILLRDNQNFSIDSWKEIARTVLEGHARP